MKKLWLASLAVFACGGFGLWIVHSMLSSASVSSESTPAVTSTPAPTDLPQYKVYNLPNSEIHTVTVPAQGRLTVSVALSPVAKGQLPGLNPIETFARSNNAIAVLNGGFFDAKNQKTASYVTINGKLVADPKQNERLTENPNLQPYLTKIWNRSEFRRYQCGQNRKYAIAPHDAAVPANCKLVDAIGGGPQLLPSLTATEEGFVDAFAGRDSIGVRQRNARSAIGIAHDGSIVLVMATQKPDAPQDSGMSLQAMAIFMQRLGIEQAMNLDGGSSSGLFYQDQTFYGKVDKDGQAIARPVKSVVIVRE